MQWWMTDPNGPKPVGSAVSPTKARLHFVTAKAAQANRPSPPPWRWRWPQAAARCCWSKSKGAKALRSFDVPPLPYDEVKIATADGGGTVDALAIDIEAAFLEYLEMFYNLGLAGRAMRRIGAVEFATTIAPGLRDVLLTGKIKEIVVRNEKPDKKRSAYDAVVVDSPPTGRIARFLDVTKAVSDLAKGGPVHSQAEGVVKLLHSDLTAIHLVTLLEALQQYVALSLYLVGFVSCYITWSSAMTRVTGTHNDILSILNSCSLKAR